VRWFSVSERGTKWGLWNISHQAGGGIILVLAGWFAAWFGWRGAFVGPAVICLVGVLFILNRLRDRPEQLGLPPIEEYRDDPEAAEPAVEEGQAEPSFFQLVVRRVLLNPHLLLLATASMCVYVVRYGSLDWATKYLVEVKGQNVAWAGTMTSLLEFVGIPGMLLAGWLSDRLFKARRAPICVICLLGLAGAVGALYAVPAGYPALDALALAAIGFFTYGPQMLLAGVAAADTCGAKVAAAAVGVTGVFSYAGAIIASAGTGALVDRWGWGGGFTLWASAAVLGALLVAPLWNARGRRQANG
jgi:sugar phosphate permease